MPSAPASRPFPLDLDRTRYSYIERYNPALFALTEKHVLARREDARVLDVGCGCGANAQAIKASHARAHVVGIEPNPRAAELARRNCDEVFTGTLEDWERAERSAAPFDGVLLSDVLEHIADPLTFVRKLASIPSLRTATWIVSVPNYAVWYNRARTLLGRQSYSWSGLWDRTHLRFFTRRSIHDLIEYGGLRVVDESSTPSLVQSAAPLLRKLFDKDVAAGEHLALTESPAYKVYRTAVEPIESRICSMWPELLGFQVVLAARASG